MRISSCAHWRRPGVCSSSGRGGSTVVPARLFCRPRRAAVVFTAEKADVETGDGRPAPAQFAAARRALNSAIEIAAKKEDYATAAQLKRELDRVNNEDPFFLLAKELEACIEQQRFQDAARLKQRIVELEESIGYKQPVDIDALPTSSDTVTNEVRVHVQSMYRVAESAPHLGQYFFSYKIAITNESDTVVQLRARHWLIRDANGKVEEVRGPGVVGVQPILLPGKSFQYDSACPLRTHVGTMEGEYEMWVLSEEDGEFRSSFEAVVGRFKLEGPTPKDPPVRR
ncbi:hypothetical protein FOA52_011894 [Chlamydomonas sp. UWO 241]|nr:hypothetical protein FOA52_011894 [Chlamydomonas sp. UWO 241]